MNDKATTAACSHCVREELRDGSEKCCICGVIIPPPESATARDQRIQKVITDGLADIEDRMAGGVKFHAAVRQVAKWTEVRGLPWDELLPAAQIEFNLE